MSKIYPVNLFVKKLDPHAVIPDVSKEGDTGYNLYSIENVTLLSLQTFAVPTGIAIELDSPCIDISIRSRSSMALKGLLCHYGTIDFGYRGELMAVITNLNHNPYHIVKGDKIAQLVFLFRESPTVKVVPELSESKRGTTGFGSTGR